MTEEAARAVAARFVTFLETGQAPPGLFARDVFVDFTAPRWREQCQGEEAVVAFRRAKHPAPGRVPRWRCDATAKGFVLELEELWSEHGDDWYCRELFRADVDGDSIRELAIYCTGDWDTARRQEHARAVTLARP